jgi:hypothetical protein
MRPYSSRIKWTPEMDALLGVLSDPQIADKLRLSVYPVRRRRVFLGIKPVKVGKFEWSAANFARLGKEPDKVLAERLGICSKTVGQMRARHDIKMFKP